MGKPGWGWHYTRCGSGGGGGGAGALGWGAVVVALAAGVVWVVSAAWPLLLAAAGVVAVLGVLCVPVLRWSRRLSVVTVSTAAVIARQDAAAVPARARARELAGQRRALEPPPRVVVLPAGDHAERARRVR